MTDHAGAPQGVEMLDSSIRPFHPVDFSDHAATLFALPGLINQLREEAVHRRAKRDALTLIHNHYLTAVLTVVRAGAQYEEHFSPEPTLFVMLEGELAIESGGNGGMMYLRSGSVGVLARAIRHKVTARTDCAYLLIIGYQRRVALPAESCQPTVRVGGSVQSVRQAVSSQAAPDAVEGLVHQLTQSIDAAPLPQRDELRTYASDLLAADFSSARSQAEELQRSRRRAPLNAAGVASLLVLAAAIFFPFFPEMAAILMLSAIVLAVTGLLGAFVLRGTRVGERLLRLGASQLRVPSSRSSRS
jgi:quercetin dioxygenase-like cupin family protein